METGRVFRSRVHGALADPTRLAIVDDLNVSDRAPSELAARLGLSGNLLAHHLVVLERVGLIVRFESSGDRRRRYVRLDRAPLHALGLPVGSPPPSVLFVCTHNSARSQLASALWQARTGIPAASAGTHPADRVHPEAVAAGARAGLEVHKEMTDSDLNGVKKKVSDKRGGTFSYTGLKRNAAGDISGIRIKYRDIAGNSANANYDESKGIPPIYFGGNDNGGIFITTDKGMAHSQSGMQFEFKNDQEHGQHAAPHIITLKDSVDNQVMWIGSGNGDSRKVEIKEVDGGKIIKVNGKEVSQAELESMEEEDGVIKKVVRIKTAGEDQHRNVMIIKDPENVDDSEIEVIDKEGSGYFFIDTDGEEDTMYFIDGQVATREEVEALSPGRIEKIEVSKGEQSVAKYGAKAKNGIVEITTKKRE